MDPTLFKVLSDANRLNIIEQLAQGEMCACRILKGLDITQPTLSHHMKTLQQCGLVVARKEGQCAQYSLNQEKLEELESFFRLLKGSASHPEVQMAQPDVADQSDAGSGSE